jgi:beta-galactosidase
MNDRQAGAGQRFVVMLIGWGFMVFFVCSTSWAGDGGGGAASVRQRTLLDAGWLFHLGDISPTDQVVGVGYDDGSWRRVDLPHDYVLDGAYVQSNDRDFRNHGYLPLEVGWYRKRIAIPESDRGKVLRLDFEGVFRDSQVWVNGKLLGRHASGYTPVSYDITKVAKIGGENVVAVRVDPRKFEGHWYEGGGIYRHVYLTALSPVHVGQWGTYVVSKVPDGEKGADGRAEVTIQTTVENNGAGAAGCEVVSEIVGVDGQIVATDKAAVKSIGENASLDATQKTVIEHPKLWSLETPSLYELRTTILQDGKAVDFTATRFGIRTIVFDADKGFFLNGKHVEIQGVANHQDMPAVGIGVPDSLQAWRVAKLKEMGCNGWRTAHNPANEAVLEECDRQGMLVMDENRHLGDSYLGHSPPGTTANDLNDLATMIRRDRNHPSVIMWSLCNEEGLRGKPEGKALFAAMTKVVHQYDRTRPITCAINGSWLANGIDDEDIIGVNYHFREYDAFHRANPQVPMFGSETTNQKTTRGEYAEDRTAATSSSYNLSEQAWLAVADRPFMAGAYSWTGFDYKGEPNPYGWPDISNNTGLMDVCGFPKDKYYYFESCWSDKPMVHLLPGSWNWAGKEGQEIRVIAFSNAGRVELMLNGRSLGTKDMPYDGHVEWQVPYEAGELVAKGYTGGKIVATDKVETTGGPARITLTSDRTTLRANQRDAVVVAVSLVDEKGRVVPNADRRVTFHVAGAGKILGVGNGNPTDHDADRANDRMSFHGRCIVIVEAGAQAGEIELTAMSPGLTVGSVRLVVK